MAKTIEQLKKENKALVDKLKERAELNRIKLEQNKLLQQNKILMRRSKHPVLFEASKRFGDVSIKASKKVGKAGKGIGKGLLKIAVNMAEADRREEALRRKASRPRKKLTPKKRTTSKKKKR